MLPGDVVTDYALKFAAGQISELEALLDDRVEYWIQGVGTFGKPQVVGMMRDMLGKVGRANTEVVDRIEMGSKVALVLRTTFSLTSGVEVVDELCLVAETRDGRIVKAREYLDQSILPHFS